MKTSGLLKGSMSLAEIGEYCGKNESSIHSTLNKEHEIRFSFS
jgi:hypothetical protein